MQQVFVTGLGGFVGKSLRRQLALRDDLRLLEPDHRLDVQQKSQLQEYFSQKCPDAVIHLAAQSHVPDSFRDPLGTYQTNFLGTLNLLEALQEAGFSGRFLYVGSSDVYGLVTPEELPLRETQPLRPRSPYAVSKVAGEALCYQWSQTTQMDIVMARPFNHIGPGQDERFAVSGFAKQIAEIRLGLSEPRVEVGNLDVTRDFTAVDDVSKAYMALLDQGKSGEIYNICSGQESSLKGLLAELALLSGKEVQIVTDPARVRPAEQPRVRGSYDKIHRDTGWSPSETLSITLEQIVKDWELKLKNG